MEKHMPRQPELWRSASAGILKKIRDGKLVLPSSERVPRADLLPGSLVLTPPEELRKEAQRQLARARTQHERAVWQQVIDSLPSGKDGEWGVCSECGKSYELSRFGASRDLCMRLRCRQQADAKRKKKEYRSSLAVRRKKIAAVQRWRRNRVTGS